MQGARMATNKVQAHYGFRVHGCPKRGRSRGTGMWGRSRGGCKGPTGRAHAPAAQLDVQQAAGAAVQAHAVSGARGHAAQHIVGAAVEHWPNGQAGSLSIQRKAGRAARVAQAGTGCRPHSVSPRRRGPRWRLPELGWAALHPHGEGAQLGQACVRSMALGQSEIPSRALPWADGSRGLCGRGALPGQLGSAGPAAPT